MYLCLCAVHIALPLCATTLPNPHTTAPSAPQYRSCVTVPQTHQPAPLVSGGLFMGEQRSLLCATITQNPRRSKPHRLTTFTTHYSLASDFLYGQAMGSWICSTVVYALATGHAVHLTEVGSCAFGLRAVLLHAVGAMHSPINGPTRQVTD